jgi:hypothetical protein
MTPPNVKDALMLAGFARLRDYSNPLAAVHAVLRRLKESDQLDEYPLGDGKKAYGKSIKRRMVEAFASMPDTIELSLTDAMASTRRAKNIFAERTSGITPGQALQAERAKWPKKK